MEKKRGALLSKCSLNVALENPVARFRAGETIRGVVSVQVDKDVRCNGLVVGLRWRTRGSGNCYLIVLEERVLFQGHWQRGESCDYPFELIAPEGPLSYAGHHVSVAQVVYATADIPWALDPKAEVDYVLDAGDESYTGCLPEASPEAIQHRGAHWLDLLLLAVFVGATIVSGLLGFVIAASISGGLGVIFGYFVGRRMVRNARLGPIEGKLAPLSVSPGGKVGFEVRFTPRVDIELNTFRVVLRGEENATSGSGTTWKRHRHGLEKETFEVSGPRTFPAEEPVVFHGALEMFETNAYSFHCDNNQVTWHLEVLLDCEGVTDWSTSRTLRVRPGF